MISLVLYKGQLDSHHGITATRNDTFAIYIIELQFAHVHQKGKKQTC